MAQYRRDAFRLIEAGLVGLFFVQAVRFLYGMLYAHISSASLVAITVDPAALANQPGVIFPKDVQLELTMAGIALLMPLLSIILGRLWFGATLAAIATAAGRVFVTAYGGTPLGVMGGAITAGAAGLYFTILAVRHQSMMPIGLILGIALDQLIRIYGNTLDITWNVNFLELQTALSIGVFVIAVIAVIMDRTTPHDSDTPRPPKGEINGWGAFALGGLFYLQFTVLGLPNLVGHRAGVDYVAAAPWLVGGTLLPLVPQVRGAARGFMAMFDGRYRGWVWFLLISLLLVVGFRISGVVGVAMLVAAQTLVCLTFWWVVQPSDGRRNFTALGMIFGILFFLLLTGGDYFTYDYAFVRGLREPFGTMLRSFRGLGLAVAIFAVLLGCLPMILARKRIQWRGGPSTLSLMGLALVAAGIVLAFALSGPIIQQQPGNPPNLRVATLNIHGGYSLYFGSDLPGLASEIERHGVDVLLVQDADAGRLVSFGVDQPAYLARALRMQVAYFPTNESLQGFAILSRAPIVQSQGVLLTSLSKQTGVQFARIRTANGSELDLYNTYLTLVFEGGALLPTALMNEQQQQIAEVLAYIELNGSRNRPTIFGGTLNQGPDENIPRGLLQPAQGFIDPVDPRFFKAENAVTFRRINAPPERVDYLFLRNLTAAFGDVIRPIIQTNRNMPIVEIKLGN